MRKIGINILIVCLYSFPFVYFSMYQDFTRYSMIGYLVMILVTSLLAFFSTFFRNAIPIILGNIASGIISFYFISKMSGNEEWESFFKPLTPNQLFVFVSCLNLLPQLIVMIIAYKFKRKD